MTNPNHNSPSLIISKAFCALTKSSGYVILKFCAFPLNSFGFNPRALGLKPKLFKGNAQNFKITYPEDLVRAQNALLIIKEGEL